MKTLEEFLTENEKLCDNAVDGPWIMDAIHAGDKVLFVHSGRDKDSYRVLCCEVDRDDCDHQAAEDSARFIAASRLTLPKALKILREIRAWAAMGANDDQRYIHVAEIDEMAERIINE